MAKLLKLAARALLLAALCLPAGALASSDEEDCPDCRGSETTAPEKIKLDDVFVHAFGGGAVTYTPTSTIIDVDKFVQASRVERVEDILMNIAGIDVMKNSGTPDPQAAILMRGFDDSRFIVAINGRPLTGSTGKANTSIDWSSLTLADIEKIEVIRGGASAAYESAEGGVINIITKKGSSRDTFIPKLTITQDASMNLEYDNPYSYSTRITADGGKGDLTYFLNFGYQSDEGYLKNNRSRARDYSWNVSYRFPFEGVLRLSQKVSELDRQNYVVNWPGIVGYDPDYPLVPEDADTFRNRAVSYDYPDRRIYKERRATHQDVSFDQPIMGTNLNLYFYSTLNEDKDYYTTAAGDQKSSGGRLEAEKHVGGGAKWTLEPWKDNSLTLGYNYKETEAREMPDIFQVHAGYVEDFWRINEKWEMKTGLRVSKVRQAPYPYLLPGEETKTRHTYDEWLTLPKFALTYNIRPETSVYISAAKDYDLPGC